VIPRVQRTWRRLTQGLERFLFDPAQPESLAICRILFFGGMLLVYGPWEDFRGWAQVVPAYYGPVGPAAWLPFPVTLPDPVIQRLQWAWRAALLLAAVGLWTRAATVTAFVLGTYLLSLSTAFGKVSHSENLVVFILLIMATARCADAWSLDTRWRRRPRVVQPSGEYRWPSRVVWVVMTIVFTLAGWQKLIRVGPVWASPELFSPQMVMHFYTNDPWVDWGLRLAWVRPFVWVAGIASLAGECLFPLALISRRARAVLVPLMLGMQINITVLFGVFFWTYFVAYSFWLPWDDLLRIGRGWANRGRGDPGPGRPEAAGVSSGTPGGISGGVSGGASGGGGGGPAVNSGA
jgi:hypothetical protein